MKNLLLITLFTLSAGQALASSVIVMDGVPLADSYCYNAIAKLLNNNINFNWPFVGKNLAGQCTCKIDKYLQDTYSQGLIAMYKNNPRLLPPGITISDLEQSMIQVPKACRKVWNAI